MQPNRTLVVHFARQEAFTLEAIQTVYQGLPVPGWQGSRPNRRWV